MYRTISHKQQSVARFYDFLKYGLETADPFIGRYLLGTVGLEERDLAGQRVLEVGIGRGNWTMALAKHAAFYAGADLSLESVKHVRDRFSKNVIQADITALPFPDSHFDRVFGIGVLPAVERDRDGFREIARVLKPGGHIYLFCYGRVWPRNFIREIIHRILKNAPLDFQRKACFQFTKLSKLPIPESVLFRNELEFVLLDWYLAPIQRHHTYARIRRWMRQENISPIRFAPYPHQSRFLLHCMAARIPIMEYFMAPDFFAEGVKA